MRAVPINPLLLLIVVQAWTHVKQQANDSSSLALHDAGLPGWPEQVPVWPSLRAWLSPALRAENLCLDEPAWASSLSGPLLVPASQRQWVAPGRLAGLWGTDQAPLLEGPQIAAWAPGAHMAVGVRWQDAWEQALPGEVLALMDRAHAAGISVWMHHRGHDRPVALSEDVLRRSTQVGWSWWCEPPATADALPQWFQSFRPAWGFWLCAPTSDQWAWPWLDMFSRTLVQKMGGRAFPRVWQPDSRQRNAYNRLEADVWSRACDVLGGSEPSQELLAQALLRLVREVPSIR